MQRTEKYYEADAFRREATGRILAVEPGKTGGKLALDGTVFYPVSYTHLTLPTTPYV